MPSKLIKILIPAALFMIIFTAAQAALINTLYMPLILKQPTRTFTPSNTYTPTGTISTATPTSTITPTPTVTKVPGIHIMHIEYNPPNEMDEYVTIKNTEGQTHDLTDWTLRDENKNIYPFPDNFKLLSGKSVKVWTGFGNDTSTNLYWDRTEPVWNSSSDCGWLKNEDKVTVSGYCYQP